MSESQLLWLVADKAEQCAGDESGLAVLLRKLAAVSGGSGRDDVGKILEVAESAERTAASLRGFITSTRTRAVALSLPRTPPAKPPAVDILRRQAND